MEKVNSPEGGVVLSLTEPLVECPGNLRLNGMSRGYLL